MAGDVGKSTGRKKKESTGRKRTEKLALADRQELFKFPHHIKGAKEILMRARAHTHTHMHTHTHIAQVCHSLPSTESRDEILDSPCNVN